MQAGTNLLRSMHVCQQSIICITIIGQFHNSLTKFRATGLFLWESTGHRWISLTKGQQRGKCFHVMTSSWESVRGKQETGVQMSQL